MRLGSRSSTAFEIRIEVNEQENERVERNDDAHQAGNGDEADAPFQFIEHSHACDRRKSRACELAIA